MAWPMPAPTYSPPSCQPPLRPMTCRQTGSTRIVAIEREAARHQRLERGVVENDVVWRHPIVTDDVDDVVASIREVGGELGTLRGAPSRVKPVVGHRERFHL